MPPESTTVKKINIFSSSVFRSLTFIENKNFNIFKYFLGFVIMFPYNVFIMYDIGRNTVQFIIIFQRERFHYSNK